MAKIHYVLLLDDSGSMTPFVQTTVSGVKQVIRTIKNLSIDNGLKIEVTIARFGDTSNVLPGYDGADVKEIKEFDRSYHRGCGTESVYDGIGTVLDHVKSKVGADDKVVINVFTDGISGLVGSYSPKKARSMIKKAHATKKYTFSFVAANQDARAVAKMLGIPASNAMDYIQTVDGTRAAFWALEESARQYVGKLKKNHKADLTKNFIADIDESKTTLKYKDIEVTINTPESTRSEDESTSELPPYAPAEAYSVDEYPACPENWEHGSSKASSYFVRAREGAGMWFDFNRMSDLERDVAVVVSVQGVNPVTGQKTSELRLEKYENQCPTHKEELGHDRFCKSCGFKWPGQNYLATTAQPKGKMWLDGFRTGDGKVRQYIFTAEEMKKGVAQAILGEDRVHAVGFAFYRSKDNKPGWRGGSYTSPYSKITRANSSAAPDIEELEERWKLVQKGERQYNYQSLISTMATPRSLGCSGFSGYSGVSGYKGTIGISGCSGYSSDSLSATLAAFPLDGSETIVTHHAIDAPMSFSPSPLRKTQNRISDLYRETPGGSSITASVTAWRGAVPDDVVDGTIDRTVYSMGPIATYDKAEEVRKTLTPKNYEVGAGARIDQRVHDDPQSMNYWEDEPYGMIFVNYCDEDTCSKILAAGKRKEVEEGFLAAVPVGH